MKKIAIAAAFLLAWDLSFEVHAQQLSPEAMQYAPSSLGNNTLTAPADQNASAVTPSPSQQPPPSYAAGASNDMRNNVPMSHADNKRLFTVSATVREAYDDNIYTTPNNKTSQFETIVQPSFLFNYPMENTLLAARYTFGATYYPDRSGSSFDLSHDFLARVNHSFSDRFNLDVRDRVLNTTQPEISSGATVNRVAGSFVENTFTMQGTAQWMPKLSTVTTFTNDYFGYDDPTQSLYNDRDVNILQNDFRFLLTSTTTLVAGGTYTDVGYANSFVPAGATAAVRRDWQSYTGYVGLDYNISPEILLGARVGGVEADYQSLGSALNPYASAFATWQIGPRSSLSFNYVHTVSQTDVNNYDSQVSDNFAITGRYMITLLTARLQGDYNLGVSDANSSLVAGAGDFLENTLGVDFGLSYELNKYLNLSLNYSYTHVNSDDPGRAYDRNVVSLGLTATY